MVNINPYLHFSGNCEEAFEFYRAALGGEFATRMRYKDAPSGDHQLSDAEGEQIIHVSLPLANGTVLMGSDCPSQMGTVTFGNNFSISISGKGEAEADRIFNALSAGGNVMMGMNKTFWGAYFGMFTDKFGIQWMINFEPDQK
ncbi:MAG TPA: VOC family protein [Blastocatellia bacterium]|nr:VOC family protein [Blastocatellia bacterium]